MIKNETTLHNGSDGTSSYTRKILKSWSTTSKRGSWFTGTTCSTWSKSSNGFKLFTAFTTEAWLYTSRGLLTWLMSMTPPILTFPRSSMTSTILSEMLKAIRTLFWYLRFRRLCRRQGEWQQGRLVCKIRGTSCSEMSMERREGLGGSKKTPMTQTTLRLFKHTRGPALICSTTNMSWKEGRIRCRFTSLQRSLTWMSEIFLCWSESLILWSGWELLSRRMMSFKRFDVIRATTIFTMSLKFIILLPK